MPLAQKIARPLPNPAAGAHDYEGGFDHSEDHGPGCDGPLNCTCEPLPATADEIAFWLQSLGLTMTAENEAKRMAARLRGMLKGKPNQHAGEIAALAGLERKTVLRALNGGPVSIDTVEKLARALRVDLLELFPEV